MKSIDMKILLSLIVAVIFSFPTSASGVGSKLDEAASAYRGSDYRKAVALYEEIIRTDGTSPQLLFNLGNSYFKTGDYGHAMLCYQRAHRLDPSDKEINNNIRYLASRIDDANIADAKNEKDRFATDEKTFFRKLRDSLFVDTSSDTWAWVAAVSFVCFIAALALYIFSRNVTARKIGFFSSIALLAVSAVTLVFSFVALRQSRSGDAGVVVGYKIMLRQTPDSDSKSVSTPLNRGTLLFVIDSDQAEDEKNHWYKVRLNSKISGWINTENFQII